MAWAYVKDGTVEEIIPVAKMITLDGVTHLKAIFTSYSWDELNALGIYVFEEGTQADTRFESQGNRQLSFSADDKKVTSSYTMTDLDLATIKAEAIAKTKNESHRLLSRFDWIIARKVSADTDIPSALVTYMAAVRVDSNQIVTKIGNCGDMAAYRKIYANGDVDDWTDDTDLLQYVR
jgi:hypothetical protein